MNSRNDGNIQQYIDTHTGVVFDQSSS